MTVTTRHTTRHTTRTADPDCATTATWHVVPGAVMILGQSATQIPTSGKAQTQRGQPARGVFRALSWPYGNGYAFLAAARFPDRTDLTQAHAIAITGIRTGDQPLPLALTDSANEPAFGQHTAALAGPHPLPIARFLLDTLRPPPASPTGETSAFHAELPRLGRMLRAFLSQAATADGCIEIMTAAPDACVLLQGWGTPLEGELQIVLAGPALPVFPGHAGAFPRPDTQHPATGVMLALPAEAATALPGLDHVFILSDAGLHSRTLVEHRLLGPDDSLGHLRHMAPSLRCPPTMQAMLHDALRPRFDGIDTLSGHHHPVHAAIDLCVAAPTAGLYLSGWVFDPAHLIAALHVCGPDNAAHSLDAVWTRIPRPDVADAFANQPRFPAPTSHDVGFAAHLPHAPHTGQLCLQATFVDGGLAFLPLTPTLPGPRLLASVDLHKPSGLPIIQHHLAPFIARLPRPASPPAPPIRTGPLGRPCAIVVPLAAPTLPRALLSTFLHDPLDRTEQLVFVCGPAWDAALLTALAARIDFERLDATIVQIPTPGPLPALREAARRTTATHLLATAPGISGRTPAWRAALRDAIDTHAFATPTLLYEDWSIRYAGATTLRFTDTAPWTECLIPCAGLPAPIPAPTPPVPTRHGSLECCLFPRETLLALSSDDPLVTEAGQSTAFFTRLHQAGHTGLWVPAIQVYAPEREPPPDASPDTARLIDGWLLRHHVAGA